MGEQGVWIDYAAKEHLLFGFLAYFMLLPPPSNPIASFIICNGLHIALEMMERTHNQYGFIIESFGNHVADILIFAYGWMLAFLSSFWWVKTVSLWVRVPLLLLGLSTVTNVVSHEFYPDRKKKYIWPFDSDGCFNRWEKPNRKRDDRYTGGLTKTQISGIVILVVLILAWIMIARLAT